MANMKADIRVAGLGIGFAGSIARPNPRRNPGTRFVHELVVGGPSAPRRVIRPVEALRKVIVCWEPVQTPGAVGDALHMTSAAMLIQ